MRILITAGPTREFIDSVRFISNPSSGRMGIAVAQAAAARGHEVTLLLGQGIAEHLDAATCRQLNAIPFTSVAQLKELVEAHFDAADALVMSAAVGDFRLDKPLTSKISRSGGPITLRLVPTEDVLAGVAGRKRSDQLVIGFAVEDGPQEQIQQKALAEMAAKHTDYTVLNTPAAMGAADSQACILSPGEMVLPWAMRSKDELAREIVRLLDKS